VTNRFSQNVLAAAYPEHFAAGVAYAGVPAGCFVNSRDPKGIASWNSTCAQGKAIASPEAWGSVATKMYPDYTGPRPKMLIYHGGEDKTIFPQNYQETTKQWCGVFGYNYEKPVSRKNESGYVITSWGPNLKGVLGIHEPHNLKNHADWDMEWFGLTGGSPSAATASI
jgi:acetylxylan esterase